jgi:hypothetical protein
MGNLLYETGPTPSLTVGLLPKVSLIDLVRIEERKGAAITGWRGFRGEAKNGRILARFFAKSNQILGKNHRKWRVSAPIATI